MNRFEGKVALVTGAAVGIGRATALQLAEGGAKLVLLDVNQAGLEALVQELSAWNTEVLSFVCDISNEQQVGEVVQNALDHFGRVDILVNNAALWRCWNSYLETPTEEWRRFMDVNVLGTMYVTRAVLGSMLENGWGRIINVSSIAGVIGNANMVHYSASKGAVIAFTQALAKEVSGKGVLVNCVSPGSVSPAEEKDIDHTIPSELSFIGRTGSDRENANLICFLASDEASYISGENIRIDGCRKKM